MPEQLERTTDLNWIAEYLEVLAEFALKNYQKHGRGAIMIDMAVADPLRSEETFLYVPKNRLPAVRNPGLIGLVEAYPPGSLQCC